MSVVAVTGASGYLGSFIVAELLKQGYIVRAVVRDPSNAEKTKHLKDLPIATEENLTFHKGNLLEEGSYDNAFSGCDAVIHTAATVEVLRVKDPQKQIVDPSVKGVRNVLQSVEKSKSIKTYVHTSSVAAIHQRDKPSTFIHDESSWNNFAKLSNDPYGFAKASAEKVVWEWSKEHEHVKVRICNPSIVLGPIMTKAHTKSSTYFCREAIYNNSVPPIFATVVDVRDVAEAHVKALELQSKANIAR